MTTRNGTRSLTSSPRTITTSSSTSPASEYMDAVRRDILGDEELERICMKIYKKHKRALDLIINCKNDLISRINEHCKEWARRKAKADEIVFDEGIVASA